MVAKQCQRSRHTVLGQNPTDVQMTGKGSKLLRVESVLADKLGSGPTRRRLKKLGKRKHHLVGQIHLAAGPVSIAGVQTETHDQSWVAQDGLAAARPRQGRGGAGLHDQQGQAQVIVLGGEGEAKLAQVSLQLARLTVLKSLKEGEE